MGQISFSDAEYAGKRKKTRREVFLEEMEQVVAWKALLDLIEPHYPMAGRGRKPYPLASMQRVHLMQNWFALDLPPFPPYQCFGRSPRAFDSALRSVNTFAVAIPPICGLAPVTVASPHRLAMSQLAMR